jgi:hypothetical protein
LVEYITKKDIALKLIYRKLPDSINPPFWEYGYPQISIKHGVRFSKLLFDFGDEVVGLDFYNKKVNPNWLIEEANKALTDFENILKEVAEELMKPEIRKTNLLGQFDLVDEVTEPGLYICVPMSTRLRYELALMASVDSPEPEGVWLVNVVEQKGVGLCYTRNKEGENKEFFTINRCDHDFYGPIQ